MEVLLKIGKSVVRYEDLFNVTVIEKGRKVMEGNILAVIRKVDGQLEEFEKRCRMEEV